MGAPGIETIQKAVLGGRGFSSIVDYRGQNAMAVTTYIPSLRWGLQIKQDTNEAYQTVFRLRQVITGLLAVTVVAVVLVARAVARSLSRPVVAAVECRTAGRFRRPDGVSAPTSRRPARSAS